MGFFSNKEQKEIVNFQYSYNEFPLRYQFKQHTLLTIKDTVFNDVKADIIWRIDKWERNKKGYEVSVSVEKNETETSSPQMKEILEFMKLFNFPIEKLDIQLNEQGLPISILNQDEIFAK